jgi:hypothetical protein
MWTGLGAVLESLRLTLRVEGPAGGPVSHEQLELAVEQCARAYWSTPAGVLFRQVRQCRQVVDAMLDQRQAAASRQHGSIAEVRDFRERLAALIAACGEPRAARSAGER